MTSIIENKGIFKAEIIRLCVYLDVKFQLSTSTLYRTSLMSQPCRMGFARTYFQHVVAGVGIKGSNIRDDLMQGPGACGIETLCVTWIGKVSVATRPVFKGPLAEV
jgi:hypothetical protein